jgi:hypothetical protein
MINKKAIVGLFTILVILMTVQSLGPAFAVPAGGGDSEPTPGNDNQPALVLYRVAVDVQGQGQVCWSGAASGCTSGSMTLDDTALYVPIDGVLTFTATGSSPVWFVDGQISQGPPTITGSGLDHTIIADFTQNMS